MALALALPDDAMVVTLTDGRRDPPVWHRVLGWPACGVEDIAFVDGDPRRLARAAARLDGVVKLAARPVVLVAEGAACFATAWWARLTPEHEVRRVSGALLFAPDDPDDREEARRTAFASPETRLPFPSLLLASDDDLRRPALRSLASEWGSTLTTAPRQLASPPAPDRPGAWRQATRLFGRYTARVVKRDIRLAHERAR